MESMSHTIAQYEHGSQKLRILSAEIDKARKAGAPTKGLLDRRYLLYTELTDMEYSLGCMKDYARSIDSKQKAV